MIRRIDELDELEKALKGRRAMVLFHATWCPYCRAFRSMYDQIADSSRVYEPFEAVVDDTENPLWEEYGLEVVPAVLFFRDGRVEKRIDATAGVGLSSTDVRRVLALLERAA